jgi:hypothetical protein
MFTPNYTKLLTALYVHMIRAVGRRRTFPTILKRTWSANFKMVRYVLLRLLRPELKSLSNEMK